MFLLIFKTISFVKKVVKNSTNCLAVESNLCRLQKHLENFERVCIFSTYLGVLTYLLTSMVSSIYIHQLESWVTTLLPD